MPRYHFHLADGAEDPDLVGHDMPDLDAARRTAAQLVGQLMLDKPSEFWSDGHWLLTVTDDRNLALFTIRVASNDSPVLRAAPVADAPPCT